MILTPNKGHLLIAEPSVSSDVCFNRSVVLLTNHCKNGSVGFILNKPLDMTLCDLISDMSPCSIPVYNGGPVEQDNLYFIHSAPDLIEGSQEISDGIYWGGAFERAIDLIINNKIDEKSIKFFLGYSGWDSLQLEGELEQHSWVLQNKMVSNQLFKNNDQAFWRDQIVELGGSYLLWSNAPENPQYN